ncbi:Fibrinogen C domain-containing protein 1-B [Holothuria leucospilota]|uniref:Fibrinogen C domain-containing protein 1-B n=1 Tax=Holothuria leucospilota TaxID=206669 RepID=A0A9Q1C2H6_HOLLE|nr:Fibrinogen C domain-containing protein 1-B [Holothuria leucospilota]
MDITFKSLRMKFHLFVVMVVCTELIEGMGFCKFQKKFPNALTTTGSVNDTSQMITSQLVTTISTAMEKTTAQIATSQSGTSQLVTTIPTANKETTTQKTGLYPTSKQQSPIHPTTTEIKTTESVTEQSTSKPTTEGQQHSRTYTDCYDVYTNNGSTIHGIYQIKPINWPGSPFQVLCNMSEGGGWTVFQRRMDGTVNFYRNWENYTQGFGNLSGEFWLGNEKLCYLTNQRNYTLRVDFVDKDHKFYSLEYDLFCLGDESDKYRLKNLGHFEGSQGISFDYMRIHENQPFRTKDSNDGNNCFESKKGAWWYADNCGTANLNGDYSGDRTKSIYVRDSDNEQFKSNIRYTDMKVRPV